MYQEFYIIRRKSDRWSLPQKMGNFSWSEPTNKGVPRLHTARKNAEAVLTQWLRGTHHSDWDGDNRNFGGVTPVESRKREDMEIVPVELKDVFV